MEISTISTIINSNIDLSLLENNNMIWETFFSFTPVFYVMVCPVL